MSSTISARGSASWLGATSFTRGGGAGALGSLHIMGDRGAVVLGGGDIVISADGMSLRGTRSNFDPNDLEAMSDDIIGRGSSGVVRQMRHSVTGALVAVKAVPLDKKRNADEIRRELQAMFFAWLPAGSHSGSQRSCTSATVGSRTISTSNPSLPSALSVTNQPGQQQIAAHPKWFLDGKACVIEFFGAWTSDGVMNIAMEAMSDSLAVFAGKPMPLEVIRCVALQLLRGLRFLHDGGKVLHRDVKPSNILYDRETGSIKISDFGLAARNFPASGGSSGHGSFVGSTAYMAPERLENITSTAKCDVWAAGITVAQLALGRHPLSAILDEVDGEPEGADIWALLSAYDDDCSQAHDEVRSADMPPAVEELVIKCLAASDIDRPTCAELLNLRLFEGLDDEAEEMRARATVAEWLNATSGS